MADHTLGPWRVGYLDGNGQAVVMNDQIEICTCWHHPVGAIEKEMARNAQLIAAAPELYEALRELADVYENCGQDPESISRRLDAFDAARAVLAKARGER